MLLSQRHVKGFYKTNVQQYIKKVVVLIGSSIASTNEVELDVTLKKERLLREQGTTRCRDPVPAFRVWTPEGAKAAE